jgi:hypothetical protein
LVHVEPAPVTVTLPVEPAAVPMVLRLDTAGAPEITVGNGEVVSTTTFVPAVGTPLGDQLPEVNQSVELLPAVQTDWAVDAVGTPMTVMAVKASSQARRGIPAFLI